MQHNIPPSTLRRTAGADLAVNLIAMIDSSNLAQPHDGSLATPYLVNDPGLSGAEVGLIPPDDEPVRIVSALAHTLGAAVYLDISNGKATGVVSKLRLGFAMETKASGAGTIAVFPNLEYAPVGTLAALAQTISGTYVQAEVQAISTKVDAIIAALKLSR